MDLGVPILGVCVQGGASCSDEVVFPVWEFLGWGFISRAEVP